MKSVHFHVVLLSLLYSFLFPLFSVAEEKRKPVVWSQKMYNPKAADDDVVLSLPCGGRMAFRRVSVPGTGWLTDRRVVLGGGEVPHLEGMRFEYVSGSFSRQKEGDRFYLIGKYEVTAAQYQVFDKERCPKQNRRGRLPARQLAWQDAMNYADKYTTWLLEHHPKQLPQEDGASGMIRLPTETEWEFAARGGAAVSESVFQGRLFSMAGALHQFVWYGGTESSHHEVQLTGLLKANPLGLYDILGNVDELVLEPFRLNKHARLHGQAGGAIIKGGNYLTAENRIRSGYRQEIQHFDSSGRKRLETTGFRLVVSAPVVTSSKRLKAIEREWQSLRQSDTAGRGRSLEEELKQLGELLTQVDQKSRFEKIVTLLERTASERNEERARAAKGMLRLGAFLGQKIIADRKVLLAKQKIHRALSANQEAKAVAKVKQRAKKLKKSQRVLRETENYFKDVVISTLQDYTTSVVKSQMVTLAAEYEARDRKNLIPFAKAFADCMNYYREHQSLDIYPCLYHSPYFRGGH